MEQDTKTYQEHIEKLIAQYRATMKAHVVELEKAMAMDAIPIYTRWQELKATIRAFETLADQTDKTLNFLDRIHNAEHSRDN